MASNDGARLTVFGVTFRQYDNRSMQQILRAYGRMPSNPGNRAALFTSLFDLSKDVEDDEAQGITDWLQNGGVPDDFPMPRPPTPVPADEMEVDGDGGVDSLDEEAEIWQEYNPADFENGDSEAADAFPAEFNDMDISEDLKPVNDDELSQQSEYDVSPAEIPPPEGENASRGFDEDLGEWGNGVDGAARPENECSICMEAMESADDLVPAKVTATCDHDHGMRACSSCLQRDIAERVQGGSLAYLNCLFCPEKFSAEEVKRYATPEIFAR